MKESRKKQKPNEYRLWCWPNTKVKNFQPSSSVPKSLARRKSLRIGPREFVPFVDYITLQNMKLACEAAPPPHSCLGNRCQSDQDVCPQCKGSMQIALNPFSKNLIILSVEDVFNHFFFKKDVFFPTIILQVCQHLSNPTQILF